MGILRPNPDKLSRSQRSGDPARGFVAKRKSRFIGELNIEDLLYRSPRHRRTTPTSPLLSEA